MADRIVPSPVTRMVVFDQLNNEAIIDNSPMRLMVGGRAILVRLAESHHRVISGSRSCIFRVRIKIRLFVRS